MPATLSSDERRYNLPTLSVVNQKTLKRVITILKSALITFPCPKRAPDKTMSLMG